MLVHRARTASEPWRSGQTPVHHPKMQPPEQPIEPERSSIARDLSSWFFFFMVANKPRRLCQHASTDLQNRQPQSLQSAPFGRVPRMDHCPIVRSNTLRSARYTVGAPVVVVVPRGPLDGCDYHREGP